MITYSEALEIILGSITQRQTEPISFDQSLGRTLAADVYSGIDMPPFNKAAMDGYACKLEDIKNPLKIIEEIPAGKEPAKEISTGECSKIMTGAVVPNGADCVIMIEDTKEIDNKSIVFLNDETNLNICYKGEDVKKGQLVLPAGTRLQPQHIAILASVGCTIPLVYNRPSIAVLSTGSELVEPDDIPSTSQIRNSNAYQLIAQCQRIGITPYYAGIIGDNKEQIREKLKYLLDKFDIILVSGGVSMGDFDYVPEVLEQLGVQILVKGMKIKPGKRLLAGIMGNKPVWVFGLPGNPVSSFVLFETFVKPFLYRFEGIHEVNTSFPLPMHNDYQRKESDKLLFVPVIISSENTVKTVEYHGSAHIHAFTRATHIMEIPIGCKRIEKGEIVYVRPF